MSERMSESEEKIVRSVLKIELFCAGILRAQTGCATLSPYVVCLNREERRYGIAFGGKVIKEYCIPETFFQVMDDIENGRILQSDSDPNLRIKCVKSYEAYKKEN